MLVDERAQDVVLAGKQIVDIGWWVVDKSRLQKIMCKTVHVQGTPPTADLTYAGVRVWDTSCQTADNLTVVGQ